MYSIFLSGAQKFGERGVCWRGQGHVSPQRVREVGFEQLMGPEPVCAAVLRARLRSSFGLVLFCSSTRGRLSVLVRPSIGASIECVRWWAARAM